MWNTKLIIVTSFALFFVKTGPLHSQARLSISIDVQPGINRTVIIQWNTKLEIDSFNYVIEKSNDKQNWQAVAGTPQSLPCYSSVDYHPAEGLNSVLHIKTPFEKGSIDAFDSEGRFFLKRSINNLITDVPTANLSRGIYFLHIKHDKKTFIEKFVKD